MIFDPNQKNVAPMYLGTVHNGAIAYRVATMEKHAPAHPSARVDSPIVPPPTPYARVGEDGVRFEGPKPADAPPGPVRVVLFGPNAKETAQSAEVVQALRDGTGGLRNWVVLPVESAQDWGAASTELVHALMDEHALAIVALDRNSSHLSEQLALKCFVPVVALSNDKSLTSANIPWIFRLAEGTAPADALRLLRQAMARGGANSEQIRNVLASGSLISGIAFESTGETRAR
jgi:hypothetical protein